MHVVQRHFGNNSFSFLFLARFLHTRIFRFRFANSRLIRHVSKLENSGHVGMSVHFTVQSRCTHSGAPYGLRAVRRLATTANLSKLGKQLWTENRGVWQALSVTERRSLSSSPRIRDVPETAFSPSLSQSCPYRARLKATASSGPFRR